MVIKESIEFTDFDNFEDYESTDDFFDMRGFVDNFNKDIIKGTDFVVPINPELVLSDRFVTSVIGGISVYEFAPLKDMDIFKVTGEFNAIGPFVIRKSGCNLFCVVGEPKDDKGGLSGFDMLLITGSHRCVRLVESSLDDISDSSVYNYGKCTAESFNKILKKIQKIYNYICNYINTDSWYQAIHSAGFETYLELVSGTSCADCSLYDYIDAYNEEFGETRFHF